MESLYTPETNAVARLSWNAQTAINPKREAAGAETKQ